MTSRRDRFSSWMGFCENVGLEKRTHIKLRDLNIVFCGFHQVTQTNFPGGEVAFLFDLALSHRMHRPCQRVGRGRPCGWERRNVHIDQDRGSSATGRIKHRPTWNCWTRRRRPFTLAECTVWHVMDHRGSIERPRSNEVQGQYMTTCDEVPTGYLTIQ